jgi:hypothetical protein
VNNAPNRFAKKYESPPVGEEGFSKVLVNAMPSVGIATPIRNGKISAVFITANRPRFFCRHSAVDLSFLVR